LHLVTDPAVAPIAVAHSRKETTPMATTPAAPIVVGVDGSAQSLDAVGWAACEAGTRERPLRIVHAFLWPLLKVPLGPPEFGPPDSGLQNAAEQILSTAVDRARQTAPELDISTDLPVCAPAAALIGVSHDAALVVIGHRGLGGFAGMLIGSVGIQAAAHAACPVVVVRGADPGHGHAGPATGQVVVGVDGSGLSSQAVDFAFDHAARRGLGVRAVHVYQWPATGDPRLAPYYTPEDMRDDQARLLAETLAVFAEKHPDVPVERRVRHGQPAAVLIEESAGAALTVVGSRGRGGFTGLLLGSTSQTVLHHATGSVAIVRPSKD
jgi:nucleotide-binding universal stress UspA family protein